MEKLTVEEKARIYDYLEGVIETAHEMNSDADLETWMIRAVDWLKNQEEKPGSCNTR